MLRNFIVLSFMGAAMGGLYLGSLLLIEQVDPGSTKGAMMNHIIGASIVSSVITGLSVIDKTKRS